MCDEITDDGITEDVIAEAAAHIFLRTTEYTMIFILVIDLYIAIDIV